MTQFIIFLIIGVAGIVVGYYLAARRKMVGRGAVERRQTEKDMNINKLKEYLKGKTTVTNDEIGRFLGVSDSTATRYMDELEKEGVVEQVGKEGRGVHYKIK